MTEPECQTGGVPAIGDGPRDGKGKFLRAPDTSARDAQAWRYRVEGLTLTEIADKMGYAGHSGARAAVERAIAEGSSESTDDLRAIEIARTEEIYLMARAIARKDHPVVSHGKVIKSDEGKELVDDGQKLAAMDRMLKAMERKAKYIKIEVDSKLPDLSLAVIQAELARMEKAAREAGDLP